MGNQTQTRIDPEWARDFDASLRRSLEQRLAYAFIRTPHPVIDDEPYRVFATMKDYRAWCRRELPAYLGYD